MPSRFDDPEAWDIRVDPHGPRRYVVYLVNGSVRCGPDKYGWVRRSLPAAFAKGDRELEKHRKRLRAKAAMQDIIDRKMAERKA